jgi:hypothetical protein
LGIFLLCFLATTRIRGTKKFLFILCFFPLLQIFNVDVRFVTTWLLGKNVVYTKLGKGHVEGIVVAT